MPVSRLCLKLVGAVVGNSWYDSNPTRRKENEPLYYEHTIAEHELAEVWRIVQCRSRVFEQSKPGIYVVARPVFRIGSQND